MIRTKSVEHTTTEHIPSTDNHACPREPFLRTPELSSILGPYIGAQRVGYRYAARVMMSTTLAEEEGDNHDEGTLCSDSSNSQSDEICASANVNIVEILAEERSPPLTPWSVTPRLTPWSVTPSDTMAAVRNTSLAPDVVELILTQSSLSFVQGDDVQIGTMSLDTRSESCVSITTWSLITYRFDRVPPTLVIPTGSSHLAVVALDLSECRLSDLPEQFHFPNLSRLKLRHNCFTRFPNEVRRIAYSPCSHKEK
jgi:hypothetical protein